MSEGISVSRFYMWRAIIAMVHADHIVTPEETEMAENYIKNVPFSEEQKATLQKDLQDAQDVGEMFSEVTDPIDQGEFFTFARMMVWCDGDYGRQEEEIFTRIKDTQMSRINSDELKNMVQESRESLKLQRLEEDAEFKKEAKNMVSFRRLLDFLKKDSEESI